MLEQLIEAVVIFSCIAFLLFLIPDYNGGGPPADVSFLL